MSRQDDPRASRRDGPPEPSALADAADREQGRLNELIAVGGAERVVADARLADLVAKQQAARRRWTAAKGRLTRARRVGSADKIAAAARREAEAYGEFDRISGAAIAEMQQLTQAGLDRLGQVLDQIGPTWAAHDAVAAVTPAQALAAITGYLDRCKLAARTVTAYRGSGSTEEISNGYPADLR
jgi:hypothetical protein